MDRKELNWVAALPWIPVVISIIFLWRYVLMSKDLAITLIGAAAVIIAALIGGVVALVTQNAQLKRDSGTLKEIRKAASEEIVPTVKDIHAWTGEHAKSVTAIQRDLGFIAGTVNSFKWLKNSASAASVRPEQLLAQMTSVFEEKAALQIQHERDLQRINALTMENNAMREEIQRLEMAVRQAGGSESQADDSAACDWEPEM